MATKKAPARKTMGSAMSAAKQQPKPATKASGGGWFSEGYDASEAAVKRAEAQAATSKGPRRFFLKVDGKAIVIFISGKPFVVREHEYKIGDSWKNRQHFTCLQGTGSNCPCCEGSNRSSHVGFYSVVDTSEYTFQGKTYKNQVRMFPAKPQALKVLNKLAKRYDDDLSGCVFEIERSGEKTPSVGDMFTFVERINFQNPKHLKKYGLDKAPTPINYREVLQPKSREEIIEWLQGTPGVAGGGEEGEVAY